MLHCYIHLRWRFFFALCCHLCRATGCWTLGKMATGSQFEEIPYLILRCWRFALIHRPSMIFHLVGSMIGKTGNSIMRCWPSSLDGSLVFVYFFGGNSILLRCCRDSLHGPTSTNSAFEECSQNPIYRLFGIDSFSCRVPDIQGKDKNKLTSCFVGRPGLFIFSFTTLNE